MRAAIRADLSKAERERFTDQLRQSAREGFHPMIEPSHNLNHAD
jgi:hypothetical protein